MRCFFKDLGLLVTTLMLVVACATVRPVPVQTTTQVQTVYRDSVVVHRDTITLEVPVESTSAADVQHSHLETSVALSDASVDSLGMLKHTLTNKPFKAEKEIVYLDRKVVEYRDSLVTVEVPVPVEVTKKVVPRWCWWLLAVDVLALLALGVWLYLKLKP